MYIEKIKKLNSSIKSNGYKIVVDKDVTMEHIEGAILLDQECFNEQYHFSIDRCKRLIEINPYTYIVATTLNNKTIGYINLMNVKDDIYEQLKTGKLIDSQIPLDGVLPLDKQETCNLYLASIVVSRQYRHNGIASAMLRALSYKIYNYLNGILPIRIIADDVSEHGVNLSLRLKFKKICSSNMKTEIYEGVYTSNSQFINLINLLAGEKIYD